MRKFLISMLLATAAATPALAGPNDWSNRQQAHEDRQQAREERSQAREERSQAREERQQQQQREDRVAERPSFAPQAMAPSRGQAFERPQFDRPVRMQPSFDADAARAARDAQRDALAAQRDERMDAIQQRFENRSRGAHIVENPFRDRGGDLRESARPVPHVLRNPHPLAVSVTPRRGTQPPMPTVRRSTPEVQWSTNWRNNHRYDWQDYRRHHRSIFHFGFYYDPFGWDYFPYQIGWRMWPSYYSQQFWINDPWMYRLPYAPPGYRWIRYWNDALLIDTWNGTVVDVIPNFFW